MDVRRAQGSAISDEAIKRIAQLSALDKEARGSPPDVRGRGPASTGKADL
ncbi:hypothetical protein [Sedimentitalea nanhaiensis]|nr:hypothetical protein [Sedimentitalea nanhaiensis]